MEDQKLSNWRHLAAFLVVSLFVVFGLAAIYLKPASAPAATLKIMSADEALGRLVTKFPGLTVRDFRHSVRAGTIEYGSVCYNGRSMFTTQNLTDGSVSYVVDIGSACGDRLEKLISERDSYKLAEQRRVRANAVRRHASHTTPRIAKVMPKRRPPVHRRRLL